MVHSKFYKEDYLAFKNENADNDAGCGGSGNNKFLRYYFNLKY